MHDMVCKSIMSGRGLGSGGRTASTNDGWWADDGGQVLTLVHIDDGDRDLKRDGHMGMAMGTGAWLWHTHGHGYGMHMHL